ncbi:MAG: leucine-rich repeat domain-containing protein, partial [Muribaculaceae bacterium]|nr:leucine-rich repeat domain-containing protein [Muribaculaceae bacterium]
SYTTTSMARIPWTEDKIARAIVRIEIGEGITEVGNYAFGCLTEVRDTRTESERYTNESDNASIKYYKLRSIKLPSTLKKIGRNAFSKINIKAISLPEGLTEIGYGAFTNCDLRSIKLPSSLRKLGAETFTGCSNL